MRDTNPMPALSVLKRRTDETLKHEGLIMTHFDVLPADRPDGVHRVRLVVRCDEVDPDVVKVEAEFEQIVGDSSAPFAPPANDDRAEKARENLTDLADKLRRKGGIL